jgi:predicted small metal-binding protein
MDQYIQIISSKHRLKLSTLARKSNVTSETAIRNIVNHLKEDHGEFGIRQALKQFVTARQIEDFIDIIT